MYELFIDPFIYALIMLYTKYLPFVYGRNVSEKRLISQFCLFRIKVLRAVIAFNLPNSCLRTIAHHYRSKNMQVV